MEICREKFIDEMKLEIVLYLTKFMSEIFVMALFLN